MLALQELAARVAKGELPPVDQRLPLEPLVVTAERNGIPKGQLDFEVGRYGGTLRSVQPDPAWNPDIFVMNDEPLLAAPGILADGIAGNVLTVFHLLEHRDQLYRIEIVHRLGLRMVAEGKKVPGNTEDRL